MYYRNEPLQEIIRLSKEKCHTLTFRQPKMAKMENFWEPGILISTDGWKNSQLAINKTYF